MQENDKPMTDEERLYKAIEEWIRESFHESEDDEIDDDETTM